MLLTIPIVLILFEPVSDKFSSRLICLMISNWSQEQIRRMSVEMNASTLQAVSHSIVLKEVQNLQISKDTSAVKH